MRELQTLRQGWDEFAEVEKRLLRELSVEEGVRQWLALQQAFAPQLQETADLFAADRYAALAELQTRLRRLAEWQKDHDISVPVDSRPPATSE